MKPLYFIVSLLLTTLLAGGCAELTAPRLLEKSREVNRIFESGTVLPDYVYYYIGPHDKPDAIIGIHKDYEFQQDNYWNRIELTKKQLGDWNQYIDNQHRIKLIYEGAYILTPDGKRAGIWYSPYYFTAIKYPAPNRIIIYPPDPTSMQRWQEEQQPIFDHP